MATHEKRNVDYFPFLCKEGKAMFYIETKYGNDGYATWIKLLRQLAVTNDHWINLSDQTELMFIAAKCKVSEEILQSIIADLSKMGEFNQVLWTENKILYSEKFISNIQDAYSRRNNKCIHFKDLCIHFKSLGIHNSLNSPTNDIQNPYIIEYNTILDNTKENNLLSETSSDDINAKENLENKMAFTTQGVNAEKEETEIWPTFQNFWDAYQKKVGNQEKLKPKFDKLPQKEKERIMEYIPAYIANNQDRKFRKDPQTFLNNKSWNDELIEATSNKQQQTINLVNQFEAAGINPLD